MLRSLASMPNKGHFPRVKRMRKARVFLHFPPSCANEPPIKRDEDLDPNHTILLPRVFIGAPLTKIHSIMDSRRGSSSRAPSPPHSKLVTLQTKGFLPPAFMVPVRAGLATYKGGKQAESVPNPSKGERVCFVPYLIRGLGFPIHPFL